MEDILRRVNENTIGIFNRNPELVAVLGNEISCIIGDNGVYISEFIIAKVKGRIEGNSGHLEVTDEVFIKIPESLKYPLEILQDLRHTNKFLFIGRSPMLEIVVEVTRLESGKTEINTVHIIDMEELKRLERKFPVLLVLARPQ